jgi:hypothetical protein
MKFGKRKKEYGEAISGALYIQRRNLSFKLLLVLDGSTVLEPESHGIHDHSLVSLVRDSTTLAVRKLKHKLRGLSTRANYTDRMTAACQRS